MYDLDAQMNIRIKAIDNRLAELLSHDNPELLFTSMNYSINAGGKRLRPLLALFACEAAGGNTAQALDIACAVEMIHTYSLIHDDLPALDNDSLRRGKPTSHVVFGEAQAILTGDALLNYAYEVMLESALRSTSDLASHMRAISCIARSAGVFGMIAGQVQDVHLEGSVVSADELLYIHKHKTADLMTGAVLAGGYIADADDEMLKNLSEYAENIGMVFQIVDDVLDTSGCDMGKTRGKDALAGKTTFASLYGNDKAMQIANTKTEVAKKALAPFGESATALVLLADRMLNRKN